MKQAALLAVCPLEREEFTNSKRQQKGQQQGA
jgi:hypothetical protein